LFHPLIIAAHGVTPPTRAVGYRTKAIERQAKLARPW
jgi:hypothetical protein